MEDWLKRLLDLMERRGLTEVGLSEEAGLHRSTVGKWKTGSKPGSKPGMRSIRAVAKVLRTTPGYILEGEGSPDGPTVPLAGIAAAGEGWITVDDSAREDIPFDVDCADPIAIEVRGNSMTPVYRDRDLLICDRQVTKHPDNLINLDCVVLTKGGEGYIKILKRGTRAGRYTLKSYDPTVEDIENVDIEWIAPIVWVKRRRA